MDKALDTKTNNFCMGSMLKFGPSETVVVSTHQMTVECAESKKCPLLKETAVDFMVTPF